jgi:hypothetical protein
LGRIRRATLDDVDGMVELAQDKRLRYETYEPTFWRVAPDARLSHRPYLAHMVRLESSLCLVSDLGDGTLDGFIIGKVVAAPPVYDPGGPTLVVDDFWVRGGQGWESIGEALFAAACREARHQFKAVQVVVVSGREDTAKRTWLGRAGLHVATEWWVRTLQDTAGNEDR